MTLHQIWTKLRRNQKYQRKRESKANQKGLLEPVRLAKEALEEELAKLNKETQGIEQSRSSLERDLRLFE